MAKWNMIRRAGDFNQLGRQLNIHPLLARLIRNRGAKDAEDIRHYLQDTISDLSDPSLFKDMDLACRILSDYIGAHRKIRIIGDYDIDGVTATAILLRSLKRVGAEVDAQIPHRVHDGYGMNLRMIEQAAEEGIELILTCDNGIAAMAETARAKELGIKMVITDHHEVPYEEQEGQRRYILPVADAVVDPKREDCSYPFSGICGAYIAYQLTRYLYRKYYPEAVSEAFNEELIQLAAVATVGDVMELREENRILVREGLRLMNTRPAQGLRELIETLELGGRGVNAYHLGFVLGPCINATGRLDTAETALSLLMREDHEEALTLARRLRTLNEERREITEQATEAAIAQIEAGRPEDKVLVVYLPDCHESVAGIVAGRIREKYYLPTLVITDTENGAKGSARSIPAYHMYDSLNRVSDLFTKFGGHAQAAGFSLPQENIPILRERLNENAALTEADITEKIKVDVELPLYQVDMELQQALTYLEPTGNGNPRPHFGRLGLMLTGLRCLGEEKKVAVLRLRDDGHSCECKLFRRERIEVLEQEIRERYGAEMYERLIGNRAEIPIGIVFYTQLNEYQGKRSVQLILEDYHLKDIVG